MSQLSLYEKLEWIHSQVQEIQNGTEIDFNLMYEFIEDVREYIIEVTVETKV